MTEPREQSHRASTTPKSQVSRPENNKSSTDDTAKEQQAVALINQGKWKDAEIIYKELISAGTGNHIVYINLAALSGMQGRPEEMIQLLNKALKIQPNLPDAHNNLGNALQERGELNAAIASFKKALELNPTHPSIHYNLGNALKKKENYQQQSPHSKGL